MEALSDRVGYVKSCVSESDAEALWRWFSPARVAAVRPEGWSASSMGAFLLRVVGDHGFTAEVPDGGPVNRLRLHRAGRARAAYVGDFVRGPAREWGFVWAGAPAADELAFVARALSLLARAEAAGQLVGDDLRRVSAWRAAHRAFVRALREAEAGPAAKSA